MGNHLQLGLDVGSTTVKLIIMNGDKVIYADYRRHYAETIRHAIEMLQKAKEQIGHQPFTAMISGSAGLSIKTPGLR